jgi:hypothetical protein
MGCQRKEGRKEGEGTDSEEERKKEKGGRKKKENNAISVNMTDEKLPIPFSLRACSGSGGKDDNDRTAASNGAWQAARRVVIRLKSWYFLC